MGNATAEMVHCKTESEVRNVAVSFDGYLDSSEVLTGTPTVTEVTTTDLTLSNKTVNTAVLTIRDESVAVGKAVQFSVGGGSASVGRYTINISVGTDSTPAQTVVGNVELDLISDSS